MAVLPLLITALSLVAKSASRPSTAIKNVQGKCVDVHAPDIDVNGAKVQVWDCNGAVQQTFYFEPSSVQGRFLIKSAFTNDDNCLDVHDPQHTSGENGAKVQMWDCNGADQQQWYIEGNAIKSSNGKCLDVHVPDITNDGGKIQIWDCNGQPQQQFSVSVPCAVDECCTDVDCNDQKVCNGDETCQNGVCVAGISVDCGFAFECDDNENKCVRDCDSFAIDDYLECSWKFGGVLGDITDIGTRIGGVDTRIDGIDIRIDGVDARIDGVDITIAGVEDSLKTRIDGVDSRIDGVDTRISDIDAKFDDKFDRLTESFGNRFNAGARGRSDFIDTDGKSVVTSTSLFDAYKDVFIIGLLVVNLIVMAIVYCKMARKNKYHKVEVFSDSENQQLRNKKEIINSYNLLCFN
eukprot:728873_1